MNRFDLFGFFKNLKTKYKIIGGFLLVMFIFCVVAGIYQFANSSIIQGYDFAIKGPIKAAFHMDEAKLYILNSQLNNEKYLVNKDVGSLKKADKNISEMLAEMEAVKSCAISSGRNDLMPVFASIDTLYEDYKGNFKDLMIVVNSQNTPESIAKKIDITNESVVQLKTIIDKIQEEARKDADKFVQMTHVKSNKMSRTATVIAVVAVIIGLCISFILSVSISNPISRAVNFAKEISSGNFKAVLEVDRKDEVGILSAALNQMKGNLSSIISELRDTSQKLSSSATELSAISSQMASSSDNTAKSTDNVSQASEEMSSNLVAIAAAMEESSTNAGMVASAAEQMTSTINEIAQNAEKARAISDDAVQKSKSSSEKMSQLGRAAQAIGKVTETITEISEQTNLLALNATIEAARAGDAGKGFAVVANEIKELAKQTARATLDIKTQIDSVQQTTGLTISEIDQISHVIIDINEIIGTIATAVEEQSTATMEIANSVNQTSQGIQEVNENISQSSQVASTITKDIAMVSTQAQEISNGSNQVKLSAEELNMFSELLNHMVSRFKV